MDKAFIHCRSTAEPFDGLRLYVVRPAFCRAARESWILGGRLLRAQHVDSRAYRFAYIVANPTGSKGLGLFISSQVLGLGEHLRFELDVLRSRVEAPTSWHQKLHLYAFSHTDVVTADTVWYGKDGSRVPLLMEPLEPGQRPSAWPPTPVCPDGVAFANEVAFRQTLGRLPSLRAEPPLEDWSGPIPGDLGTPWLLTRPQRQHTLGPRATPTSSSRASATDPNPFWPELPTARRLAGMLECLRPGQRASFAEAWRLGPESDVFNGLDSRWRAQLSSVLPLCPPPQTGNQRKKQRRA